MTNSDQYMHSGSLRRAAYRDVLDDDVVHTIRHPETLAQNDTTGTFTNDLHVRVSICSDTEY